MISAARIARSAQSKRGCGAVLRSTASARGVTRATRRPSMPTTDPAGGRLADQQPTRPTRARMDHQPWRRWQRHSDFQSAIPTRRRVNSHPAHLPTPQAPPPPQDQTPASIDGEGRYPGAAIQPVGPVVGVCWGRGVRVSRGVRAAGRFVNPAPGRRLCLRQCGWGDGAVAIHAAASSRSRETR
jgi:hypothetical protein